MNESKSLLFPLFTKWMLLSLGVLLATIVSLSFYKNGEREFELRFETETEEILHDIQNRLTRYELALLQARAFVMHAGPITEAEFQNYLKNTELMERYPGVQALGYVEKLSPSEIDSHVRERKKDNPDYHIWPDHTGEVLALKYIAPRNWRNQRAVGFNMMTESVRRKAMLEARDSGRPAISGFLTLMQENNVEPQPGLILFVPYYGESVPQTIDERRMKLKAYLSAPFRLNDFIESIFSHVRINDIDFEIYENQKKLYDHDKKWNSDEWTEKVLKIGNFSYPVRFSAKPNFEPRTSLMYSGLIFAFGLLVTFLVVWIFHIMNSQVLLRERSLEAKDEFLSVASHELKTPITSIQMQLQMLQRGFKGNNPPSQEKVDRAIRNSIQQVGKMNRLIEELLETSRLERGKLNFQFEITNLANLVHETLESHSEMLTEQGNNIELQLDENVSAECDCFRMEQVLTNLLTNAIKYGEGSKITVALWQDSQKAYLSVKDRGPGISASQLTSIFERFERGRNNKSIAGLGLGLYISRQIIIAHQGTIRVESAEGQGAEFIVEIPLKIKT